jgi:hypothetical protein
MMLRRDYRFTRDFDDWPGPGGPLADRYNKIFGSSCITRNPFGD